MRGRDGVMHNPLTTLVVSVGERGKGLFEHTVVICLVERVRDRGVTLGKVSQDLQSNCEQQKKNQQEATIEGGSSPLTVKANLGNVAHRVFDGPNDGFYDQ